VKYYAPFLSHGLPFLIGYFKVKTDMFADLNLSQRSTCTQFSICLISLTIFRS
jgi:hypothetical protein